MATKKKATAKKATAKKSNSKKGSNGKAGNGKAGKNILKKAMATIGKKVKKYENSLDEVFMDELKDIYGAEKQLLKALPKMAKAATSAKLRAGFEEHLEVTKNQVERVEKVFSLINEKASSKKCKAMEGLIKEGDELISELEKGPGLDAALICAAQKVEHYEIAAYGCLRTYAKVLGHNEAAKLLQQTLEEEGETDKKLTTIAEGFINERASEVEA